jgi:hypothetical protein
VITENLEELREIEPINFQEAVDLSQRNATISFCTFSSSIMPTIYKVIFGSYMPKISEVLKMLLQNPDELIGDWFCFRDYTVIRIYGFEGEPFNLPKFTSRRLFALEYLRHRLVAKNDNFIKPKKASSIKFNFTIEPFVVKYAYAIIAIDQILRSMSFETDKALRYDPKGVINQRRMDVNFKGYDDDQD